MTDQEKCPECGYPQSRYHRDIAFDCLCTGDIVCEGRALKRAKVELAVLRLEVAAWRALAEHHEQAARLLRGFIRSIRRDGVPLVPEWRDWVERDEAIEATPRKPATKAKRKGGHDGP